MSFAIRSIALAMACLIVSEIYAQPGAGFGSVGLSSRISLIGLESVQLELQMDAEQLKSVKELTQQADADLKAIEPAKGKVVAEQLVGEKYRPLVGDILRPTQLERLDQILVQVAGANIYRDPAVIELLKLSNQQQMDMAEIDKRFRAEGAKLPQAANPIAQMKGLAESRKIELAAVLTPEQQTQLGKLRGAEFDVSRLIRNLAERTVAERRALMPQSNSIGRVTQEATVNLVSYPEILKEIQATADQIAKLEMLTEQARTEMRDEIGLRPQPDYPRTEESRAKGIEWDLKRMKVERDVGAKYKPKLAEVLSDVQVERLNQIELQAAGMHAYTFPEVAAELKMSQEQQEKIGNLVRNHMEQLAKLFNGRGFRPGTEELKAAQEKAAELSQTFRENLDITLTDEQRQKFATMLGPKFDTNMSRRVIRRDVP